MTTSLNQQISPPCYPLPDPISDELARQDRAFMNAWLFSELFALAEEHFDAQIVIAAQIEEKWATVIQQRIRRCT